jgi:hypothetical protein
MVKKVLRLLSPLNTLHCDCHTGETHAKGIRIGDKGDNIPSIFICKDCIKLMGEMIKYNHYVYEIK